MNANFTIFALTLMSRQGNCTIVYSPKSAGLSCRLVLLIRLKMGRSQIILCIIPVTFGLSKITSMFYRRIFPQSGQHYNLAAMIFDDHFPKVIQCVFVWSLRRYVRSMSREPLNTQLNIIFQEFGQS